MTEDTKECFASIERSSMLELYPIRSSRDIAAQLRDTPIGKLIEYHNLDRPYDVYSGAQILIGMCMDNRKHLHIPENFAFIIRTGGANLRYSDFRVSYAIAVGGVRYIALIGHSQCGMTDLRARKELFVRGLIDGAGWDRVRAEKHFDEHVESHEIGNETEFVVSEARRLESHYPRIKVEPFIDRVEDNLLYGIKRGE